jgi:hypothetical protein
LIVIFSLSATLVRSSMSFMFLGKNKTDYLKTIQLDGAWMFSSIRALKGMSRQSKALLNVARMPPLTLQRRTLADSPLEKRYDPGRSH